MGTNYTLLQNGSYISQYWNRIFAFCNLPIICLIRARIFQGHCLYTNLSHEKVKNINGVKFYVLTCPVFVISCICTGV